MFAAAPDSRCTITRLVEDIANYLLRAELLPSVQKSPYFSLMLDGSLDNCIHEQCNLILRYVDFTVTEVVTKFFSIVCIQGTPDAKTIYEAVNKCAVEVGLPKENQVRITTDGAVIQENRNSVRKLILQEWNEAAFKQHCVVHKEVLGVLWH